MYAKDFSLTLRALSPKERLLIIGLFGLELTSTTGAKLILTPIKLH